MANYDGVTAPVLTVQFYIGGTWTSINADDVLETNIRRGVKKFDLMNQAGVCAITFNNYSGNYDPDNTSSSLYPNLKAGLQMRFQATWSSTTYTLFKGYLESSTVNQGHYPSVTMTFVDGLASIADVLAPMLSALAYEETAATRVGRMLDYASWPVGDRSLSGSVTMQKTVQGRSCLVMINQAVNVIAGRFYISRSGVATLVPLSNKFSRPTQLLFSDQGDAYSLEYQQLLVDPGTYYVVNQAIVDRGAESRITSNYLPSQSSYGLTSRRIDAPILDATSGTNLALYQSRQLATPATFAKQIDFKALNLGVLYPDFLNCEIGDQVTVKRLTVDGRNLTYNLVIEGMTHRITSIDWKVSFHTSPMNPYSITL